MTVYMVTVDCPECGLPFATSTDQNEAEFLAGVHNALQHAGINVATVRSRNRLRSWTQSSRAGRALRRGSREQVSRR
jgi:hypothetical protein